MQGELGKCYINKTWRFLMPCLRAHGDEFVNKFNHLFKLGVGIFDTTVSGTKYAEGRNIFIMLDKAAHSFYFNDFMEFVRGQSYFVADYCPEEDILKARRHIIVLEVPGDFHHAYDQFLLGNYSQMYTEEELKTYFNTTGRKVEYAILKRTDDAKKEFIKKIKKEFNTDVTIDDLKWAELELPLKRKEEVFNYKNQNKFVYINETIEEEEYEYNFN